MVESGGQFFLKKQVAVKYVVVLSLLACWLRAGLGWQEKSPGVKLLEG